MDRIIAVIDKPRPFIKTPTYVGPCRRRTNPKDYMGPWRRANDDPEAEQEKLRLKEEERLQKEKEDGESKRHKK